MVAPRYLCLIGGLALAIGCHYASPQPKAPPVANQVAKQVKNPGLVIHVIVALCDNKYQGIVPVPAKIGNGDDLVNNLYWGCSYGVKAFFRDQKDWEMIPVTPNKAGSILERVVFKHRRKPVYLVADAYRGREIKQATSLLFAFASGNASETIQIAGKKTLSIGGGADMLAYVGHDGLMDFQLDQYFKKADRRRRDVAIFACKSKQFFSPGLKLTGANPIVWTTNLMAPEAYVLKAAIDGWLAKESGEQIRLRVAESYNKYQRCGIRGARNTFATGW